MENLSNRFLFEMTQEQEERDHCYTSFNMIGLQKDDAFEMDDQGEPNYYPFSKMFRLTQF